MIEVTVRLLRASKGGAAEVLGVAQIANVGGTKTSGDYAVRLFAKGGRVWKHGTVEGFPRRRLGAWDLLFRALGSLILGRNPKVLFPAAWEEATSIDPGSALADVEEHAPQAGEGEDPRRKALVEALDAWVKCDEASRIEVVTDLRTRAVVGHGGVRVRAARVLEALGEAIS